MLLSLNTRDRMLYKEQKFISHSLEAVSPRSRFGCLGMGLLSPFKMTLYCCDLWKERTPSAHVAEGIEGENGITLHEASLIRPFIPSISEESS
jgi:hypothetical protein